MAGADRLRDLDLSAEEAERLRRAFRDERFRALFAEFAAELNDPGQRRLYEEEVAALERERGMEARFVHPTPGFVLRTSQEGSRRCYINVCSNALMGEPRARAERGGQRWELPYSLAPGREELRPAGRRRLLYDVVFHPTALRLAARSARFRRLLCDTALEAVESRCGVRLDRHNATVLRGVSYKGIPQAPVIRSPLPGGAPKPPDDGESPLPPFPFPPAAAAAPPPAAGGSSPAAPPPPSGPTTPRWSIRHRSYVDLQDYRHCRDSAPSPVPRELVVTVELPLLRSAEQAELEIRGRELRLDSRCPAYRLRLLLPYDVNESAGRAAFNRAQRQLQITLPVVPPREPPAPGGERPEGSETAPAEAGPAEEGGGAAPPPELGPGGGARSTCGGGEPGDAPAQTPAEPLCDPPAAPCAEPLTTASAELPVEPPCDPPAESLPEPSGEPRVDPTSEPSADSPAEPATDPTSEPPAGPTADPLSEPFTEPAADPTSEPPPEPPGPSLPSSGAASPMASPEPAMPTGDTPPQASEGYPSDTATCPPFRARQDEASLTLLLLVPGIQPQSLRGDVGTHHYSLRFRTATAAFSLFLRFPPAAALVSPESSVSVSAHNAVVGLAKAPGSTGLWDKFSFGLEPSALQERLFVSEENVDGFLGTASCPSPCSQSALERQPLIEVLDVTEARIQIRVQPQEGDGEGTVGSSGGALAGNTDSNYPKTKAETKCPAAEGHPAGSIPAQTPSPAAEGQPAGSIPAQTQCPAAEGHPAAGSIPAQTQCPAAEGQPAGSIPAQTQCPAAEGQPAGSIPAQTQHPAAEGHPAGSIPAQTQHPAAGCSPAPTAGTMGKAGCASHHCLQREPPATGSAIPGGSGRKEPDLESAAAAGGTAPAPGSGKAGKGPGDGDGEAGPGSRGGSPELREVNPEDGSVRLLRDHRTRCPVLFQNPLLYELD